MRQELSAWWGMRMRLRKCVVLDEQKLGPFELIEAIEFSEEQLLKKAEEVHS